MDVVASYLSSTCDCHWQMAGWPPRLLLSLEWISPRSIIADLHNESFTVDTCSTRYSNDIFCSTYGTYEDQYSKMKRCHCKIINRRVEWYKKYSTTNRTRDQKIFISGTTSVARSVWYENFLVPSEIRSGIFFISRDPEVDNFIITLQFSELEFLYHFGKKLYHI